MAGKIEKPITKEYALMMHRELWVSLGQQSKFKKDDVSKFTILKGMFGDSYGESPISHDCFCCEYAKQQNGGRCDGGHCKYCPVKWPTERTDYPCEHSLYGDWMRATREENFEKASEICFKIAELASAE